MTNMAGESSKSHLPVDNQPIVKYLTTGAIFLECITFGCAFNLFSPLLVELRDKYETNIDSMSKVFIVLTVSYLSGAMAGGVIYGKLIKRQHGVAIAFTGISFSLFATPYCPTITHLFICVVFLGFTCGMYDTAQTVWIMEIWKSKSGPYIQAQHFCFALGANLPSLLTAPFLSDKENNNDDITSFDNSLPIRIPFSIVAGLALMNVFFELFLITCYPYVTFPENEISNPDLGINECGKGNDNKISVGCVQSQEHLSPINPKPSESGKNRGPHSHKILLVTLSGMFLGFYQGMEMCSIQFIPTLAQFGNSKLSGTDAALVLTGLTGAFAIGRAIGILITFKVSPQRILSINAILVIVGNVVLLLWAYLGLSSKILWCGCIILGLGFSTMYASWCSFMERHLVFTDFVGCVMLVSGSIVGMIYPAFVGKFVEHNPEVLTYTNFCSVVLCSIAFITAYIITRKSNVSLKQHYSS